MATIEVIIRDDNGNIINQERPYKYALDLKQERFTDIEGAIDNFKKRSSKELTLFILEYLQYKFTEKKKL